MLSTAALPLARCDVHIHNAVITNVHCRPPYLIACQGKIIGVIDEWIFQVSCHLIQAPVALHTEEVDHNAHPRAVHKGNNHQGHRNCIHDEHDQYHLSPGEREGGVCNCPAGAQSINDFSFLNS